MPAQGLVTGSGGGTWDHGMTSCWSSTVMPGTERPKLADVIFKLSSQVMEWEQQTLERHFGTQWIDWSGNICKQMWRAHSSLHILLSKPFLHSLGHALGSSWDLCSAWALPAPCCRLQTKNQTNPTHSTSADSQPGGHQPCSKSCCIPEEASLAWGEEAETKIQGRRWEVWTVQDKWTFTLTFVLGICCQNIWIMFLLVLEIFTKPSWAGTDEHPCGTITTLVSNKIDGLSWWRGMSLQLSFQLGGI